MKSPKAPAQPSVHIIARFRLGVMLISPGAQALLGELQLSPLQYLRRHVSGDWRETCKHDAKLNEDAIGPDLNRDACHGRIMSVYKPNANDTIWVITEWDRSATTILLPSEY